MKKGFITNTYTIIINIFYKLLLDFKWKDELIMYIFQLLLVSKANSIVDTLGVNG